MSPTETKEESALRPPVVAVLGHIDHGKSKLLDYIRKTNVVEGEAGNITQHLSAYEVELKDSAGRDRKITFLDTPGHAAFEGMRRRGAKVADLAILVVSAEEGVKTQTTEALRAINQASIPFIVAINKIDKPGANVEKTKASLVEHEIYLEGFGGQIPFAEISAQTGAGVDHLLELILLVAEMEDWKGDVNKPAEGFVIEAHLDPQRGISATLLIKNGTLKKGAYVAAGGAYSGTRILENFLGESIEEEAIFSSPVRIVGWSELPAAGAVFETFTTKRAAEIYAKEKNIDTRTDDKKNGQDKIEGENFTWLPLVVKSDTGGTGEALKLEIEKIRSEFAAFKIVRQDVGAVSEADMKAAGAGGLIVGFNVKIDAEAAVAAEQVGVLIKSFNVIYQLTDWLREELEKRRPRQTVEETVGKLQVLKIFKQSGKKQIVGGRVLEGLVISNTSIILRRRNEEIGRGEIVGLEQNKNKVKEVATGNECGLLVESPTAIAVGDILEIFRVVEK